MVSRTIFLKTNNFRRIRRALLAYVRCGGLALKGLNLSESGSLFSEDIKITTLNVPLGPVYDNGREKLENINQ